MFKLNKIKSKKQSLRFSSALRLCFIVGLSLMFFSACASKGGSTASSTTENSSNNSTSATENTTKNADGSTTTVVSNTDGTKVITVTLPDGSKFVSTTDKNGGVSIVRYDGDGNVVPNGGNDGKTVNKDGSSTTISTPADGTKRITNTKPDGSSVTTIIDPKTGVVTTVAKDPTGVIVANTPPAVNNNGGNNNNVGNNNNNNVGNNNNNNVGNNNNGGNNNNNGGNNNNNNGGNNNNNNVGNNNNNGVNNMVVPTTGLCAGDMSGLAPYTLKISTITSLCAPGQSIILPETPAPSRVDRAVYGWSTAINGFAYNAGQAFIMPSKNVTLVPLTCSISTADCNGDGLIEISNADELNQIRFSLEGTSYKTGPSSAGVTAGCPQGGCRGYILTKDIDLGTSTRWKKGGTYNGYLETTGTGWQPIGWDDQTGTEVLTPFNAIFDGNGYKIKNLYINRSTKGYQGLFAYTGPKAQIKNIGIENADIYAARVVGGLVAWMSNGSITNSYVKGNASLSYVSNGDGKSYDTYFGSNIGKTAPVANVWVLAYMGLLVGKIHGASAIIKNSYTMGFMKDNGANYFSYPVLGGLVGAVGELTSTGVRSLGGATISNSYSWANMSCSLVSCGGLVGMANDEGTNGKSLDISNSYYASYFYNSFISVSANGNNTCALQSDKTVKCWGANNYGQLGDNTNTNRISAVAVSGLSNVTQISSGGGDQGAHTCALQSDKTVKCWGANYYGQLGDGFTTNQNTPVTVSGLSNVTQISADGDGGHTCALLSDNTVKCWGYNGYGQLGDSTSTNRSSPVAVSSLSNVTQISTGGYVQTNCCYTNYYLGYTCALLDDKTVKCWGYNNYGQLGDGTTTTRTSPVAVSGLSNVTQISVGGNHTCATLSDKTVKCWGYNGYGQLGDNTTTQRSSPVAVSGLSNVTQISTGYYHTCALLSDKTVKCWGYNNYGQLGDNTTTNRTSPVVVSGLSNVTQISTGDYHTCATLSDKTVKCWGRNDYGQLGDGTLTTRYSPVYIKGIGAKNGIFGFEPNSSATSPLISSNVYWDKDSTGTMQGSQAGSTKDSAYGLIGYNKEQATWAGNTGHFDMGKEWYYGSSAAGARAIYPVVCKADSNCNPTSELLNFNVDDLLVPGQMQTDFIE